MNAIDEIKRLEVENQCLRRLLQDWYDRFAPLRKDGTEGAEIIDRTARALNTQFTYKDTNHGIT